MESNASEFLWPIRVYYEDTDCGGVVYHSNYLNFMERARTEWLRHLGVEQDQLLEEYGVVFAVRSAKIDFLLPARFNSFLVVVTTVTGFGRASIELQQAIRLDDREGQLLCKAQVKVGCIDLARFKACPMPEHIYSELSLER